MAYVQPSDPKAFIRDELRYLQNVRARGTEVRVRCWQCVPTRTRTHTHMGCLQIEGFFTRDDIEAMFGMLDVVNTGAVGKASVVAVGGLCVDSGSCESQVHAALLLAASVSHQRHSTQPESRVGHEQAATHDRANAEVRA